MVTKKISEKYSDFEEALKELEMTVSKLDSENNISLEELANNYQDGLEAYNFCIKKLEETKKIIRNVGVNVKK